MITGVFNSCLDSRSVFRSYPKKNSKSIQLSILRSSFCAQKLGRGNQLSMIQIKGWFNTKITPFLRAKKKGQEAV
jgi:hypothetical protein